ncbi:hypothetical protein H4R26_004130 [Coemansia thaxteri]|uniref:Uncharacterized protein n=1 Tax=Coemansia thaxteri TaxID=2663907 RepID=A0A9W8EEB1_9FUNG|nr:hypothetical protein H4R26_004130 [Coemansia thaxteri]KAJ2484976.1 hypothetical protein EV174_002034 [Coemansia sp. RSA 2320]
MTTAASAASRMHELEAEVARLRDGNSRAQGRLERAERERQQALEELEALHSSHSRLEARFFEAETGLGAAAAKLERTLRTNTTLEAAADQKAAALDREREAWHRREVELNTELAAAKRRATVQRRQTVAGAAHSRSGSVAGAAHGGVSAFGDPQAGGGSDHQAQARQLARRLREAEARAQQAGEQAGRLHMEAEQAAGSLDALQRKAERLEHTVRQLSELNESLREDNESYQVLLQMSTMRGGLSFANPRASLDSRASSTRCPPPDEPEPAAAQDLASELGHALHFGRPEPEALHSGRSTPAAAPPRLAELEELVTRLREELRKTKYERRHLSDENKALSLYVNKILARILASSDGLEAVLSRDYDAPPAPRPRARPPATSLAVPRDASTPPAQGSGDGITSVFIPPTSPTQLRPQAVSPAHPLPPPTRRARSATVAGDLPPDTRCSSANANASTNTNADANAAPATIGGAWWKRMSVRLGSGWNVHEEAQTESS